MTVPARPGLGDILAGFGEAERLGLHSAWFSQPPDGLDALTMLALAATRTSTVRLGTAVIPTYPRHPLVTARAAQTAAAAAPGRVTLGVSAGHRAWIEQAYGLRFDRPVAQVTEWVTVVRRLLRGEALAAADNAFGITAAAAAAGAATAAAGQIPVVLAATGPRLLTAAGRVADGVLTWMCDAEYLTEVVLPCVARGADSAGRPPPPVTAGVLMCVSDDARRTRAALAPRLASLGGYHSYRTVLAHGRAGPRAPADVAVIGGEAGITAGFGELAEAGVSETVAVVLPDPDCPAESARRAGHVLAGLAAGSPQTR